MLPDEPGQDWQPKYTIVPVEEDPYRCGSEEGNITALQSDLMYVAPGDGPHGNRLQQVFCRWRDHRHILSAFGFVQQRDLPPDNNFGIMEAFYHCPHLFHWKRSWRLDILFRPTDSHAQSTSASMRTRSKTLARIIRSKSYCAIIRSSVGHNSTSKPMCEIFLRQTNDEERARPHCC